MPAKLNPIHTGSMSEIRKKHFNKQQLPKIDPGTKSVDLSDKKVEYFSKSKFAECLIEKGVTDKKIIREIKFGESLNKLDELLLSYNYNDGFGGLVKVDFKLCEKLFELPHELFMDCQNLTTVVLPPNLQLIYSIAFFGCVALTSIKLPKSLLSIQEYAFFGCESLKSLELPLGVNVIGKKAFCECSSLEEINIPKPIIKINEGVFKNCVRLNTVNFNKEVRVINSEAFLGCTSLESITLPETLNAIYHSVFMRCISLKGINIPNTVREIGKHAFCECSALTSITFPPGNDNLSLEIHHSAFMSIPITSIKLPTRLNVLGVNAFYRCTELGEVDFSETQLEIFNSGIFTGCVNLKKIIFPKHTKQIKIYDLFDLKCPDNRKNDNTVHPLLEMHFYRAPTIMFRFFFIVDHNVFIETRHGKPHRKQNNRSKTDRLRDGIRANKILSSHNENHLMHRESTFDLGQLCSKIKVVYIGDQTTTSFDIFKSLFIEAYKKGFSINTAEYLKPLSKKTYIRGELNPAISIEEQVDLQFDFENESNQRKLDLKSILAARGIAQKLVEKLREGAPTSHEGPEFVADEVDGDEGVGDVGDDVVDGGNRGNEGYEGGKDTKQHNEGYGGFDLTELVFSGGFRKSRKKRTRRTKKTVKRRKNIKKLSKKRKNLKRKSKRKQR